MNRLGPAWRRDHSPPIADGLQEGRRSALGAGGLVERGASRKFAATARGDPMRRSYRAFVTVALAVGIVVSPRPAMASTDDPVPIPGGIETHLPPPYGPVLHVFAPGPTDLGFMGVDAEPNTITDFGGFAAMGHFNGTIEDVDGNVYDLGDSGIRVYQGNYRSADGSTHQGTFVFLLIELYDPASGSQLHNFNGGFSSGLCWTVRVPDSALEVNRDLKEATLHIENADAVDDLQRFGGANIPATVSLDITWTAAGPQHHYKPGSTDPTDPTNFDGKFRIAVATGTLSGSNAEGFSFTTVGNVSTEKISSVLGISGWAEMGIERNGSFL